MNVKKKILYLPLGWLFVGVSHLPFRVLYAISDAIYFIIYHVVRYRVNIARANVRESFPEKSDKECEKIVKGFYRHFSDYMMETIKLLHISDEEMKRRMMFENVELIDKSIENRHSVLLYLGHYGNWEYITSITLWVRNVPPDVIYTQVYRQLRNEWFDELFLKIRGRFHSICIEKRNTFRGLLKIKNSGKLSVNGFMSDQHPSGNDKHHVIKFLNHNTAMITGTEVLAQRLNMDVLFFDIEKVKRGHYKAVVKPISTSSADETPMAITDAYADLMENAIRRQPELWLWTHKRWKHKCENPTLTRVPLINSHNE